MNDLESRLPGCNSVKYAKYEKCDLMGTHTIWNTIVTVKVAKPYKRLLIPEGRNWVRL